MYIILYIISEIYYMWDKYLFDSLLTYSLSLIFDLSIYIGSPKVTLTLDYNGGKSQEGPEGVGSVEVELDKGTVYTLTDPAADPDFVIPDGKNFDGWSTVKDDTETKIEGTSVTVNENMTLYILWV